MHKLDIVLFLLLFGIVPMMAEREKEVLKRDVHGEYTITNGSTISMEEAKQLAREDAKKKALVMVCGEQINAWDVVESSAAGESYNSLTTVRVDGEIVDFDIQNEFWKQNPLRESELVFTCIANVTVKKGIDPDPNFVVDVTGVSPSYIAESHLTFSVKPYSDCYLKVFIFENAELGYRLYPNEAEKPMLLEKANVYHFPSNDKGDYELYTDKEIETDRLVFVFTKDERPFYNDVTSRTEIEQWMARIPNDQKYIYYTSINIVKKH